MRNLATLALAVMLLAATASAQSFRRIDRSVVVQRPAIRLAQPRAAAPQPAPLPRASSDDSSGAPPSAGDFFEGGANIGTQASADTFGQQADPMATPMKANVPPIPDGTPAVQTPAEFWGMENNETYTDGPDKGDDKDFGFDKEYFGIDAGYGARAASIETRRVRDDALVSEEDDLHAYALAAVRALGFKFTALDAEVRAHREMNYGKVVTASGDSILRLVIKNKTKINQSGVNRAEYLRPAVEVYFLGGGETIGIGDFGVTVEAGVGAEIDVGVYAEISQFAGGHAELGGVLDAYVFAKARAELDALLFKVTVEGKAKLMDTQLSAPITAGGKKIEGAVDLHVTPFTSTLKLVLSLHEPYEVRVRVKVWTYRFWEWKIEIRIRWRWVKVTDLELAPFEVEGFDHRILDFEL